MLITPCKVHTPPIPASLLCGPARKFPAGLQDRQHQCGDAESVYRAPGKHGRLAGFIIHAYRSARICQASLSGIGLPSYVFRRPARPSVLLRRGGQPCRPLSHVLRRGEVFCFVAVRQVNISRSASPLQTPAHSFLAGLQSCQRRYSDAESAQKFPTPPMPWRISLPCVGLSTML